MLLRGGKPRRCRHTSQSKISFGRLFMSIGPLPRCWVAARNGDRTTVPAFGLASTWIVRVLVCADPVEGRAKRQPRENPLNMRLLGSFVIFSNKAGAKTNYFAVITMNREYDPTPVIVY